MVEVNTMRESSNEKQLARTKLIEKVDSFNVLGRKGKDTFFRDTGFWCQQD